MIAEKTTFTERDSEPGNLIAWLFWVCMTVVALVPLVFSTALYRIYVLPKFALLLVGSALILLLLGLVAARSGDSLRALKSKQVVIALLYVGAAALSTVFGVSRLASFFGSFQSEMGLIARLCFLVCFIGLITAIGSSRRRFVVAVWVIAATGLVVSVYAFVQFFGWDPFLAKSLLTMRTQEGPVVRAIGTLGHSNYLGNFLLYTTPLTASLALGWRGRARRIALVGLGFSVAAIVFSGTRGAWLGLFAGSVVLALLEVRKPRNSIPEKRELTVWRVAIACAGVSAVVLVIALSPASRNVSLRVRSFVQDRFTGAGRLLLWRDAINMVPRSAVVGCGPEAFSREFLAYKSQNLARSAPTTNNESSHNSYLDAAISFGLPGAILYAALIASSFSLLLRARRRAADRRLALIAGGLCASIAAIAVHNFFIYDQVPTGLYFFSFASLAVAATNVAGGKANDKTQTSNRIALPRIGLVVASTAILSLVAATWFSASLIRADIALKGAMISARDADFEGLIADGELATTGLDPTGSYNFEFARALTVYADVIAKSKGRTSPDVNPAINKGFEESRAQAIETAIEQTRKSLAHTLTPDASYLQLAYLELAKGDTQATREYADEAIRWDPNYFGARWLMAEALLREGDRDGAIREARIAKSLNPASTEAESVFVRARGRSTIQQLIERARVLEAKGNLKKAKGLLHRALRRSQAPCPDCHRELALLLEKEGNSAEAKAEWDRYAQESAIPHKGSLPLNGSSK